MTTNPELNNSQVGQSRPDWNSFENVVIDHVLHLKQILAAGERSAVLSALLPSPGFPGDSASTGPSLAVVVKLYRVPDHDTAEAHLTLWRKAQQFEHPNLLRILNAGYAPSPRPTAEDASSTEAIIYVATEPVEERLEMVLSERRLDTEEAAEILHSLVSALGFLHDKGYVHGHLSPQEILAAGNRIKLSPEWMRRIGDTAPDSFEQPRYIAPEMDLINQTEAADVWCLGASLAEAFTGKKPLSFHELEPQLPQPLRAIFSRCLEPQPEKRGTLTEIKQLAETASPPEGDSIAREAMTAMVPSEPLGPEAALIGSVPANSAAFGRETTGGESLLTHPKTLDPRADRPVVPLWAYGVGLAAILLALFLLFRSRTTSTVKTVPAASNAGSVPSAQPRVITPTPDVTSLKPPPKEAYLPKPSPRGSSPAVSQKESSPATAVPSQVAPNDGVKGGAVWRVVVFTYAHQNDAEKKVREINRKNPQLNAGVYQQEGKPFMVTLGSGGAHDEALQIRKQAIKSGLPRDSYVLNFNH